MVLQTDILKFSLKVELRPINLHGLILILPASQNEDSDSVDMDIYQLEILDSNMCFCRVFIEVTEPDSLSLDYIISTSPCPGESTGVISSRLRGNQNIFTAGLTELILKF